jgi:hypothetical protein
MYLYMSEEMCLYIMLMCTIVTWNQDTRYQH